MNSQDFVYESAAKELASKLPSLAKHDYSNIDKLMKVIAQKHKITDKALHDLFVKEYKKTPDIWVSDHKLDETQDESSSLDIQAEVDKFVEWAAKKLNLQSKPKVELSTDSEEAQDNHHTGSHIYGENSVWVYVKNRNLVDILRTVAHELTHVRQGELGMIKPGSSYPGSPIELLADMVAGKLIKLYGAKNHHIFQ